MCDFFSNNSTEIWIAFIGAFFGFGLALVIEAIGRFLNKRKEKKSLELEKYRKITYYCMLLEEIVEKTKQQTNQIDKYIDKQSKKLLNIIPLNRISTSFFNRIKTIDNKGVFEALSEKFKTNNEWIKRYSNLNSSLDYLDGVLCGELSRINSNTIEKGYNDLKQIKALIDNIPDVLSKRALLLSNELGDKRKDNPEYNFLNSYILKYRKLIDKNADLDKFNTDFLTPLLSDIVPFQTQSYALDITFACKQARVKMTDVKSDISYTIENYKLIKESFNKPVSEIETMIKLLKP